MGVLTIPDTLAPDLATLQNHLPSGMEIIVRLRHCWLIFDEFTTMKEYFYERCENWEDGMRDSLCALDMPGGGK